MQEKFPQVMNNIDDTNLAEIPQYQPPSQKKKKHNN